MEITEKVAYLKGLAEGMELDTEKKEGKLLAAIIDVLDDMALEIEDLKDAQEELGDGLDAVSDDLEDVEDVVFSQLEHRYVDVKEMALEACINLHSSKLNERFKERFRSDDAMQRMMAVYALGRYSVSENLSEITEALEDADPAIRRVAVESFLNMGGAAERYLPRLLPRLFDEDKMCAWHWWIFWGKSAHRRSCRIWSPPQDENDGTYPRH